MNIDDTWAIHSTKDSRLFETRLILDLVENGVSGRIKNHGTEVSTQIQYTTADRKIPGIELIKKW